MRLVLLEILLILSVDKDLLGGKPVGVKYGHLWCFLRGRRTACNAQFFPDRTA